MLKATSNLKIFGGNSHPKLAQDIANRLEMNIGQAQIGRFSDGEISVSINESVRGSDVFVVQSISNPVNENLMELLVMIDAFKRASACSITAVIPYFGYARQDRKAKARDPITAKLVADLLVTAGASSILTMDLHAPQLQGFFSVPVNHLQGMPILHNYFAEKLGGIDDLIVASPDVGSVSRARSLAQRLNVPLAIIDKRREAANQSQVMNVIGDVMGKRVIIIDDLIDTAGTIVNAADALSARGAKEVYACCTHAILSGSAIERLEKSAIKEVVVLNTVPLPQEKQISKIKVISVGELFSEVIRRVYNNISISPIFD